MGGTILKAAINKGFIREGDAIVYDVVTAQTESSIPLYSFDTEMTFEFLLAESILIGNVPDLAPYAWNDLVTA